VPQCNVAPCICHRNQVVLEEGDFDADRPRFGAACTVEVADVTCTGGGAIDIKRLVSDVVMSKYLNVKLEGPWVIGSADSEVDRTLERCLQTMRPLEKCEASFRVKLDTERNCFEGIEKSNAGCWVLVDCVIKIDNCLNADPVYRDSRTQIVSSG
jgi:hypothetical protein